MKAIRDFPLFFFLLVVVQYAHLPEEGFNHHNITRDEFMLHGPPAHHGYDWWWHSFIVQDAETGEDKPFFIEFFVCNPALAEDQPVRNDSCGGSGIK